MKLIRRKKFVIPAIVGILALVGAGAAYAYFTTTGSGSGSAYVGSGATISFTQDTPDTQVVYDSLIARSLPIRGACHSRPGLLSSGTRSTWYRRLPRSAASLCHWTPRCVRVAAAQPAPRHPEPPSPPCRSRCTARSSCYRQHRTGASAVYDTQTFTVPYRPSAADVANPGYCTGGTNWSGYTNDGSQWYDPNNGNCYYGIDYAASFSSFTWTTNATSTVLPRTIVYGIAFTATSGPSASLNMEMSTEPTDVTLGSDADPGNVFVSAVPLQARTVLVGRAARSPALLWVPASPRSARLLTWRLGAARPKVSSLRMPNGWGSRRWSSTWLPAASSTWSLVVPVNRSTSQLRTTVRPHRLTSSL